MNTRHAGAAAIVASAGLACSASARTVTEDFMNTGGTAAEFDSFFNYDFGPTNDYPTGDAHNLLMGSLLLQPDKVSVTFNLQPSEEIIGASLLLHDYAGVGMTRVTFEGDAGSYVLPNFLHLTGETFFMPTDGSIGHLQRIIISGQQTNVRWIEIETEETVPAPGAIAFGGVGLALAARRRRR